MSYIGYDIKSLVFEDVELRNDMKSLVKVEKI